MSTTAALMNIGTARTDLAAILTAAFPDDWGVIDHLPDSVAPPCAMIAWSDPWLKPATLCAQVAQMEIICVAQRIEPGGKLETLEQMVGTILPAIKGTAYTLIDVTSPFPMQIAGVDYLVASVNITYDMED